jgi:hypothetical protein
MRLRLCPSRGGTRRPAPRAKPAGSPPHAGSSAGSAAFRGVFHTTLLASAGLLAAACSSGIATLPTAKPGAANVGGAVAPKPSAARYVLTQLQGAAFDEASRGVAVPRPELAIVMGRRVKLEGGVITGSARAPAGLVGFRSLPERLGGGYLVWSDLRTYHTKDFFGALTPVAEIGPTAGARPWFSSVLLRTDRGIFELSMAAGPKAPVVKRWRPQPGVIDALSIDEKRGVTLDIMGRARATTDGGATWSDVTAARGYFSNGARLGKKGEIELLSLTGSADLRLLPGASAVEPTPPPPQTYYGRRYNPYSPYQYNSMNPSPPPADQDGIEPISQTLAPDALVWAAAVGLLLDGERALVGRDAGGLQVLSTKTGAELDSGPLLGVSTEYSGCQPVRAGASILLACAHAGGAQILTLDGPLTAPKLEATFPDAGPFLTDDRGHLAHLGRCGRTPPSADDFGARPVPRRSYDDEDSYNPGGGYGPYGGYGRYGGYDPEYSGEPEEVPEKETPPADDKRICVRLDGGHWIEHRLTGDDAKDVYRWVLGDDGEVTVLLLKGVNPDEEDEDGDKDKDGPSLDGDDDDSPLRKPRSDRPATSAARGLLATPPGPTASPAAPPSGVPFAPPRPMASGSPIASGSPKAGRPPAVPPKTLPAKPEAKKPEAKKPEAKKLSPAKNGMRLVRLDPKDRVLKKGKWTQIPTPQTQAPWRSLDRTFWLEPDGSIRGWMHLDADDGDGGGSDSYGSGSMGDDDEPDLVSTDFSGRFAGVRISPQGKATVLPLPAHVHSVLFGGVFGLARADDDDRTIYYETTDGGATWTEVEGPPVGELEDAYDESRFPACSAVGCALSSGLVRVGWGSPKPAPPKKEKDPYAGPGADPFPVPRLPKMECTFDGEPEAFPAPPPKPKPKTDAKTTSAAAVKPSSPGGLSEDVLSQLPPDIQQLIRDNGGSLPPGLAGMLPPGLLPPGLVPPSSTSSPVAPPSGSAGPSASSKPKAAKPAKPPPPPKPPPAPPAEVVSLRSKPQSALGQLKDKSWNADFVAPFDPTAAVKHLSTASNGLEKLTGYVVPVLGDRGVDLMLTWDKRRANLGAGAPSLLPFDYNGRLDAAVFLPGPAGGAAPAKGAAGPLLVALDDARHVLVLVQPDASRAFLRTARIPDPTRGKLALARRLDAPGAALVWYSPYSGDVLAGAVDFARAEIAPLVQLASTATLVGADLAACTAKPSGVTYELLLDLQIPVTVLARSGKSLFSELNVPSTLRIRASAERLCVAGVEVRGSGRPLDLTASFGAKSAAVARSRASAEDASKLSLEKLSCVLHEPESK